jgi:hypothetical protein
VAICCAAPSVDNSNEDDDVNAGGAAGSSSSCSFKESERSRRHCGGGARSQTPVGCSADNAEAVIEGAAFFEEAADGVVLGSDSSSDKDEENGNALNDAASSFSGG